MIIIIILRCSKSQMCFIDFSVLNKFFALCVCVEVFQEMRFLGWLPLLRPHSYFPVEQLPKHIWYLKDFFRLLKLLTVDGSDAMCKHHAGSKRDRATVNERQSAEGTF